MSAGRMGGSGMGGSGVGGSGVGGSGVGGGALGGAVIDGDAMAALRRRLDAAPDAALVLSTLVLMLALMGCSR
jgi:hypothetical protein